MNNFFKASTFFFSVVASSIAMLGCTSTKPEAEQSAVAVRRPSVAVVSAPPDTVRDYVQSLRSDLSRGKVGIINDVMKLSPDEAKKFWPIYQDYEEELFSLGDRRVELTRKYVEAYTTASLDDKSAAEISLGWLAYQSDVLELTRKYHGVISTELSPLRAGQFLQIEHRVGTVVDLLLASELPLVQKKPAASGTEHAKN